MNKGLFFSGIGILIFQSIIGLFLLISSLSFTERTGNLLIGGIFFGSLTLASVTMMIVGAVQK